MELRKGFDTRMDPTRQLIIPETQHQTNNLNNRSDETTCKTSFLIEDILFRGNKNNNIKNDRLSNQTRPDIQEISNAYEQDSQGIRNNRGPSPKRVGYQTCYGIPEGPGFRHGGPVAMTTHDGYIQSAMSALGVYLNTGPGPYKSVETPYFLSQGK